MVSDAEIVPQGDGCVLEHIDDVRRWQSTGFEFRIDLTAKGVTAPPLDKSRRNKRRHADPRVRAVSRAKQLFDVAVQWLWKAAQRFESTTTYNGNVQGSNTAFCPGAFERTDCCLSDVAEAHWGVNQQMIEVPIGVEIEG